ncbi:MAG: OmpA family protein [Pseudomonadota bacterium]
MADYDGLTPGQVLADASVADFIKSLGLSVAEAQKALDINSVEQLDAFIKPVPGLGGKTLLDMGLMPAFYHFQHADISCSMNLSLRVEKDFGVNFGIEGNFSDTSSDTGNTDNQSSSSSSGSATAAASREAKVKVDSKAVGALSVNGQANQLAGADPEARIRALAKSLQEKGTAGTTLVKSNRTPVNPTSNAPGRALKCESNAVVFLGGGFHRGVIRVSKAAAQPIEYDLHGNIKATGAAGDIPTHAASVTSEINAKNGYSATNFHKDFSMGVCLFDHDVATVAEKTAEGVDNDELLTNAAEFLKDSGITVVVEGRTDRSGKDSYNQKLSVNRAENVIRELVDRGVNPSQLGSATGTGETAWGGPDDNSKDPTKRVVLLKFPENVHYIYVKAEGNKQLKGTPVPDQTGNKDTGDNGWVSLFRPSNNAAQDLGGQAVTIKNTAIPLRGDAIQGGAEADSVDAFAANFNSDVNANAGLKVSASRVGRRVSLMNEGDDFELTLVTTTNTSIQLSGSQSVSVTTQFSRSSSNRETTSRSGNRTVAVGASLDVRYGRQFEMNVTGNSAISARLVSVPAPPEFLATMKEFLTDSEDD